MNLANIESAKAFTAGEALNQMNADQRISYVDGVVSGLAYARWLRDKPDQTGFQCINDWRFKNGIDSWKRIVGLMERHQDKPVSALVHVLAKKECGE